jgi:hypothetical protein
MKWISFLLLGVVLTGLGCVPPAFMRNDPPPPPKPVEIKPPPAPPVVTPESVNENNAVERARALREELEHESSRRSTPPAEKD